jgi:uncharacterized protein (TIGR03083 family)
MPTRPLPPEGLTELVSAYGETAQAVLDLGSACHPDEFGLPTQCPGWTVKDQIAHVAGIESAYTQTGREVVQELAHVLPRRLRALRDPALTLDSPLPEIFVSVEAPDGAKVVVETVSDESVGAALPDRIVDVWVHEQDLREALDRPGNLDSPAAAAFVERVLAAFPRQSEGAALAAGSTVIIECTGPVLAREGVRITPTSDGSLRAEPLFSGHAHIDETDDSTGELIVIPPGSVTTIRLTTEALTRRGAGRVPTAELRYSVDGDGDIAARVLDELAVTP